MIDAARHLTRRVAPGVSGADPGCAVRFRGTAGHVQCIAKARHQANRRRWARAFEICTTFAQIAAIMNVTEDRARCVLTEMERKPEKYFGAAFANWGGQS